MSAAGNPVTVGVEERRVDGDPVWNGPIFGQRGVLADDGERAQCHICGGYFGNLGGHATQVHGVEPDEYKELFGLNVTTGLIGPALKELRRREGEARKDTPAYQRFVTAGVRARATLAPEQRSHRGRRLRLEQRLNPRVQAARRAALARANDVLRKRKEAGLYQPVGWGGRDAKEVSAKGHARLAELRADPAWREAFARKVSEARGGRLKVTCVICGAVFTEPQSHRRKKTCGPACLTELRRRTAAERQAATAEGRAARIAEGIALGRLRRERNLSVERLAAITGLSAAHVSRVERGLNVPSGDALHRMAAALATEPQARHGGSDLPSRDGGDRSQPRAGPEAK